MSYIGPMVPTPLLLRPDNFTPSTRTPWGGTRLMARYKSGCGPARPVGESWEISVEPDFPSRGLDGRTLAEHLAGDPTAWLGDGRMDLLVKLLDAGDDLSVQIHPGDDYAGLGPGEGGKPESWYVLDAEPGAGLYLGFRQGVGPAEVRAALAAKTDLSALLFFVPVQPGDLFVIDAGTPHAVGRGVTLVEPQRVRAGRRGLTYRYWDWNRRYDAQGRRDPGGQPRALQVADALAVTRWDAPREDALLQRIHQRAGPPEVDGVARLDRLAGASGPVHFPPLSVARLAGTGALRRPPTACLQGLTVVAGQVQVGGVVVETGRSAALPAAADLVMELSAACALLTAAP